MVARLLWSTKKDYRQTRKEHTCEKQPSEVSDPQEHSRAQSSGLCLPLLFIYSELDGRCNKAKCSKVLLYFIKAPDGFSSNKFKERLEAFLMTTYTYSLKNKTKKQEQRGNLHLSLTYFY